MVSEREAEQQERQPRGARKRARTRADLLAAARRVFASRGYHDANITDITSVADVGVGTFYLHFRDKDAIFHTLIEEGLVNLREQVVKEVQQQGNPTLPVVIRAIFRRAYEQRDLFRIAIMGGGFAARRFHMREMLAVMFTQFLEQTRNLSPFTEEDIPLLALLLSGTIIQAITWWFEQDEPDPDTMADRVLHVMRHGFPAALFEEQLRPPFSGSDELHR